MMATAAPTQKAYDAVSVRRHILKLGANAVAVALHSSLPPRPRRVSGGEGEPGLPSGCSSPLSRQSIRRCPDGAPVILRSHGAGSRGLHSFAGPNHSTVGGVRPALGGRSSEGLGSTPIGKSADTSTDGALRCQHRPSALLSAPRLLVGWRGLGGIPGPSNHSCPRPTPACGPHSPHRTTHSRRSPHPRPGNTPLATPAGAHSYDERIERCRRQ